MFPPDLKACGVALDHLVVVHVPGAQGARGFLKSAELLLRSGAFACVVLDLTEQCLPAECGWQGRLLGLARAHQVRLVLITEKDAKRPSLGPLVGFRFHSVPALPVPALPERARFEVPVQTLKNKMGVPCLEAPLICQAPPAMW